MSAVRIIALGSEMGCDDAAAIRAAERLASEGADVLVAGRPGPGLVDLIEPDVPIVLLDVVRRGARPGEIVELSLDALAHRGIGGDGVSSHGLGPADALRLAKALGRALPRGTFVGIGGGELGPGDALSDAVAARLDDFVSAARRAAAALAQGG